MNRPTRVYFMGLLAVGLIALGIERLIVTDREAIEALAENTAKSIQERKFDRLAEFLHPEFEHGGRDKEETVAYVRGLVRKFNPIGTEIVLYEINVNEDTATAQGAVAATVYGRPQQVKIDVVFRKLDDTWLLKEVKGGGLPR